MSPRRVLPAGLVALATAAAALTYAPSAMAATDESWTGASTSSQNWSDNSNWSTPFPATSAGAPIGNLTFGSLAACATAGSSCTSTDDIAGNVYAQELHLGAPGFYNIYPAGTNNFLYLEGNGQTPNVGLSAMPAGGNQQIANVLVPLELTTAQTWQVGSGAPSGYANLYLGGMGQPHDLTFDLDQGWIYADDVDTYSGTDPNSNTLTVQGPGEFQLNYSPDFSLRRLPAVKVQDSTNGSGTALGIATPGATSGNIDITGTNNNFIVLTNQAPGETTLAVSGDVTMDSTTNLEFDIDGNNTTPGVDSSQMTVSGNVNFGGGDISLWQARDNGSCDVLTPGTTYTLLKAGSLSGSLTVGSSTIMQGQSATETFNADNCPNASKMTAQVNYNATSITATILGVQAGAQAPQIGGTPTVGDTLQVTGNGSWIASPAPTYAYQWYDCSGGSCSAISGATGASYVPPASLAGTTIKVNVTASNGYGSASAFSNTLGPIASAAGGSSGGGGTTGGGTTGGGTTGGGTTGGGTTGGGTTGGNGPTTTIVPALKALIRADLARLRHPAGRRAIRLVIRRGIYRTRFSSAASGFLSVVWKTRVTIGKGRHARHLNLVVARGSAHTAGSRPVMLTIRLTATGKRLLRVDPFHLRVIASERFLAPGSGWTTLIRRFML
jgi:hypothetical protein